MKKITALIAMIVIAALGAFAVNVTTGPAVYDMASYGTTLSVTNASSAVVHFATALIAYDNKSTNTVSFSKIDGGTTFLMDTEVSSSTTATTDVWENPFDVPFYPGDVLKIGTTDTNIVINLIKAED